jgi:catechol 2,3-dioxygenase-like lactoylglutathione lyase family enzyme
MNGHEVLWTFHSTAMVRDYDEAIETLTRYFGLRVLEYTESEVPAIGRRGGMTWIGDNSIEIGQPFVPGAGAWKFVEGHGGGIHSVALQVRDVEATIVHLSERGVHVVARPDPRFFFSDPKETGGVFFEWADIEMKEDPRFGAPEPAVEQPALLDVRQHAFIGALVDDPSRWAERFVELFGTELAFENSGASLAEPRVGVSLNDQILALFALPGEHSQSLWGREYLRSRTHLIGLRVPSLDEAAELLGAARVEVVARTEQMLVVDSRATGGVQIALVQDLFPGDPRLA